MKKRCLAILLTLAMCLSMLPVMALPAAAAAEEGVTLIESAGDFAKIAENLSGSYRLTANIDTAVTTPIGTSANPFTGTFDGDGHTINLDINKPGENYLGLFAALGAGAVVKNVTVKGSVSGFGYLGGIAGKNTGGTVENCHNQATVTGSNTAIGGIVGYSVGGTVTGCTNSGSISNTGGDQAEASTAGIVGKGEGGLEVVSCGNSGVVTVEVTSAGTQGASAAGIVGNLVNSTITSCYNTGNLISNGPALGGILGFGRVDTITNCYNTGNITGTDSGNASTNMRIGGIAGHLGNGVSSVFGCYTTGKVVNEAAEGDVSRFGGIVGKVNSGSTSLTYCYYPESEEEVKAVAYGNPTMTEVKMVTADDLASGEVAWLLRKAAYEYDSAALGVWGQDLSDQSVDAHPMLTAIPEDGKTHPVVSKVTAYDVNGTGTSYVTNEDFTSDKVEGGIEATGAPHTYYINAMKEVDVPATTLDGYKGEGSEGYILTWYRSGENRTAANAVTAGTTYTVTDEAKDLELKLYPALRVKYAKAEKTLATYTYGAGLTGQSLDSAGMITYADGTGAADNFTYALKTADKEGMASKVTVTGGKTLAIDKTVQAGTHTLTFTARELDHKTRLAPAASTSVTGPFYLDSTDLTGKVVINKKALTATVVNATNENQKITKVYDGDTTVPAGAAAIKLTGQANGDNVTATASFAYNDSGVKTANKITATNITLAEAWQNNYTVNTTAQTTGVAITPVRVQFLVPQFIRYTDEAKPLTATILGTILNGKDKDKVLVEDTDYTVSYYPYDAQGEIGDKVTDLNTLGQGTYQIRATLTNPDNYAFEVTENDMVEVLDEARGIIKLHDLYIYPNRFGNVGWVVVPERPTYDGTVWGLKGNTRYANAYKPTKDLGITVKVYDSEDANKQDESKAKTLILGTDYELDAISEATTIQKAGRYGIKINGLGQYAGTSTTIEYFIDPVNLEKGTTTVTVSPKTGSAFTYNGKNQFSNLNAVVTLTATVNGKSVNFGTLKSADYTVSYTDASGQAVTSIVNAGTYDLTVKVAGLAYINDYGWPDGTDTTGRGTSGKGNFMGSVTKSVTIQVAKYDLASALVTFDGAASGNVYTFDGTVRKPSVTLKMADGTVIPAGEYTVELLTDGLTPGEQRIVIKANAGSLNYTGQKEAAFTLKASSITVPSGESAKTPSGGTVTNNGGKGTVTDKNGATTGTITPAPAGGIEVDEDGNVIVPAGSTFTPPKGRGVELDKASNDGLLEPDGDLAFPDGGTIHIGDVTAKIPEDGTLSWDDSGSLTLPQGSTVKAGDTSITPPAGGQLTVDKNGDIALPAGSSAKAGNTTVTGDGIIVHNDGSIEIPAPGKVTVDGKEYDLPKGGTVNPDGSVSLPEGGSVSNGKVTVTGDDVTIDKNGNIIVSEEGTVKQGDVEMELPDGGTVKPDGSVSLPNGGTAQVKDTDTTITSPKGKNLTQNDKGEVVVPNGGTASAGGTEVTGNGITVDKDGNIHVPGGAQADANGTVVPGGDGVYVDSDGKIHVPPGGTVQIGDTEVTLPQGGTVNPDGSVTVPNGGTVEIGDTVVTPPDGGELTPNENGGVYVPGTASADVNGTKVESENGFTVHPDGSIDVPEGGQVTINDVDIGLNDGGTVNPDGSLTLDPNGSVQIGDETVGGVTGIEVVVPGEDSKDKDRTLKPKSGGVSVPPGATVNGDTVPPQGGVITKKDGYTDNSQTAAPDLTIDYILETIDATDAMDYYVAGEGETGLDAATLASKSWETISGDKVTEDGLPLKELGWTGAAQTVYFRYTPKGETGDGEVECAEVYIPARPDGPALSTITVVKSKDTVDLTGPKGKTTVFSDDQQDWTQEGLFENLTSGQAYTFYARYPATKAKFASKITEKNVTPVDADGTTTLKPGETVVTEDGRKITNENGSITMTDEDGHVAVIPPTGGEMDAKVDTNGKGAVDAPANSVVDLPDGTEMTLPNGGTVGGDGSVTVPDGSTVQIGDTEITPPTGGGTLIPGIGGGVDLPAGSSAAAGGTTVTGDGIHVDKDGNITVPKNGKVEKGDLDVTLPDGGTVEADGSVTLPPNGRVQDGDVTVTFPKGGELTTDENGDINIPKGGSVQVKDTTVTYPQGGTLTCDDDGNIELPAGATVTDKNGNQTTVPPQGGKLDSDGNYTPNDRTVERGGKVTVDDTTVTLPDGGTLRGDGSVTPEGGKAKVRDTELVLPEDGQLKPDGKGGVDLPNGSTAKAGGTTVTGDGLIVNKDGSITVPENGQAQMGEDTTVDLPQGGTVNPDGSITVPDGGSAEIEDTTITPPSGGGTLKKDEAGNVIVPDGGSATAGATDDSAGTTVTGDGVTVGPDGTIYVPGGSTVTDAEGNEIEVPSQGGKVKPDGTFEANPAPDQNLFGGDTVTIDDTTVTLPEGGVLHADGSVTPNDGKAKVRGTELELPEGGKLAPDEVNGNVILPDGSTAKAGNTEVTGDGIVVDNNGAIHVPAGGAATNGDTTVEGGDGVVVNPDGSITVPEGGSAQVGNTDVDLPAGGKVNKDGSVDLPAGGSATAGNTTVEGGDGVVVNPDGSITVPPGGKVGGQVSDLGGTVTSDGTFIPNESDDQEIDPEGTVKIDDTDVTLPQGGTLHGDGSVTPEDGKAKVGDTEIELPEGGRLKPDTQDGVDLPNGSTAKAGDTSVTGDGIIVQKDGSITVPKGGKVKMGDTDLTLPDGGTVDPDGSVTVPEGKSAKVGNTDITPPKGGNLTTNDDGDVVVPDGGSAKAGDTEVTGDGITVDKDGNITVPPGASVNGEVSDLGGTVDKNGKFTPNTADITGTVTDGENNPVAGATVTLVQGGKPVLDDNGKPIQTTTDERGEYEFKDVLPGLYNVVAEKDKVTKTILLEVASDNVTGDIRMPDGSINSLVEVKGQDTPAVVVGSVDEVAEAVEDLVEDLVVKASDIVTVTLTVEAKDETEVDTEEKALLDEVITDEDVLYLDMSLHLKVDELQEDGAYKVVEDTKLIDTGNKVLTIIIPYDFTGKSSVTVYRSHEGAAATLEALTSTPATPVDGTFFADRDHGRITIYATQFSTYAIGYTLEEEEPDEPLTSVQLGNATVTAPDGEVLTQNEDGSVTAPAGSTVHYAPDGPDVVLESEATVDQDGNIILPKDGSVTVNDTEVTLPQGGKLTSDGDGNLTVPAGALVNGTESKQGGTVDKNGKYTANGSGSTSGIRPSGSSGSTETDKTDGETKPCDGVTNCPSKAFADLDTSAWYHEATDYVIANGLMNGMAEATFAPGITTTRAMIVTILWRLEGEPQARIKIADFTDVVSDAWYTEAVRWATEQEIVEGYGDGRFGPEDTITREQLAAILYRYAKATKAEADLTAFVDAQSVSDWATEAMAWAVSQGIITSKDGKRLDPQGSATRAEAAAMLMRFAKLDK